MAKYNESYICDEYKNGRTTTDIAKELGTYNTTIRRILMKYNIPLRSPKEAQTRVHTCPLGDNAESEYLLGLYLTDGCICTKRNSHSVQLSLKDKELVEQVRDILCPANKVSAVPQKQYGTVQYAFSVKSDLIANWFFARGNFQNKSYDCDIYVPITWNIFRGIFDGDGYWHMVNNGNGLHWGICSRSYTFIQKIGAFLDDNNIKYSIRTRLKPLLYYIEVYKTVDVCKIAINMYDSASIYLKRKYEIWRLLVERLKAKFPKFKEGCDASNPEPSHSTQFVMEGAETIMGYLRDEESYGKGIVQSAID